MSNKIIKVLIVTVVMILAGGISLPADDFFSIKSVKYLTNAPKDGYAVWKVLGTKHSRTYEFEPCLEVAVVTREDVRSDELLGKAYFYDQSNKQIAVQTKPSKSGKQSEGYPMPVIFYKGKPDRVFFEVPPEIRGTEWKAVVVFGDKNEAKAVCYPATATDFMFDYPEKNLVYDHSVKKVDRKPAMNPLIEEVVKTKNPKMPQITLFLRPPKGISDPSEVKGVLAICVLAGGIEQIKRDLSKEELPGDYAGLFGFANKEKLAILVWGSHGLWNPNANFDDLQKAQAKEMDESFDTVAEAWEKGVKTLCEKYGLPDHDFLLWGSCGSAQWAHRLCLRKPQYFLAIDIHIPGSFDKPTPEASSVLWCLTTGELYGGYQRSLRFVQACRALGYPMVYKAIVGLGHSGSPIAKQIGFKFFEYALTMKELRDQRDKQLADVFNKPTANMSAPGKTPTKPLTPWPQDFQHPPFYGDMVNQEVFPQDQVDMIPAGFRIPLPTKEIADAWRLSK